MQKLFDLTNKVALVTGGSKGLGLAMAQGLASAGATVAVSARNAPTPPMAQAIGTLPVRTGEGSALHFIPCDLLQPEQRADLVDKVVAELGGIDILLHCAGAQHREPAADYPMQVWRDMHELHLTAAFDLSRQAAQHMIPKNAGKIILVSSVIGFQGGLYIPGYASAKHAVVGLVRSLANEWAKHGINVNAIAPGYMNTEMLRGLSDDPTRWPHIQTRIPAGRLGEPDELVGAAIYLASAASSYVNGHALVVDGGWLSR
jgi:2-deoxy-D-gluconate 3-dehydrogenase